MERAGLDTERGTEPLSLDSLKVWDRYSPRAAPLSDPAEFEELEGSFGHPTDGTSWS